MARAMSKAAAKIPAAKPRRKLAAAALSSVPTPLEPMEAELVESIPSGGGWQYEPKWDGFRAIVFRDGEQVIVQSKAGQPLGRYFPEVVDACQRVRAKRFVIDGELVTPVGDRLSFDNLLMRIHPAASRVRKLSEETPAIMIVFDLLADSTGKSLLERPLIERRAKLEAFFARYLADQPGFRLSPATEDARIAKRWFRAAGASLDGVMAKRTDLGYQSGNRHGMVKVKPRRTADCVVGGFRYASRAKALGSLLLGLYNDEGLLDHIGFTSSFNDQQRRELLPKVEALVGPPGFTGRAPGGPSRWSTKRSAEWEPLKPKLVVEVSYDHFTGGRFRHGTTLVRWRPEKAPRQCGYDQLAGRGAGSLKLLAKPG